jgi:poly-gamma-glutamate capsule biosynthesis protein CapA/YwtB (metallophosphatase superfamily)
MKSVSILVGGDIAPTQTNYSLFEQGAIGSLIDSKLLSLINSADLRLFNLEVPLTDQKKPIVKDGPNLIAPQASINALKLLNPAIFGLANNHIMDQDDQGLIKTIELLAGNGSGYVGAGKNLSEALKPYIIEKNGKKIGVYACAENEFSIAEINKTGANPFDPLESLDHIATLKSECDYVIVLHHGGKEHYRYPSPGLQKVCRKMSDKGADLIICQHSHCIGAFEKYADSIIVYGQGNFLFDRRSNEFWNTGLLVNALFGDVMTVSFIPVSKNGNSVTLPDPDASEKILSEFQERSQKITTPGFIESEYENYCFDNGLFYLGILAGFGRITRRIDRMLNGLITRKIYNLERLNILQNFVECETHRELLLKYLNLQRKKRNPDLK